MRSVWSIVPALVLLQVSERLVSVAGREFNQVITLPRRVQEAPKSLSSHSGEVSEEKKVVVGFYSEALCPYCRGFMKSVLEPMFENGLNKIATIDYVPFGNARYNSTTAVYDCQHGKLECELNKVFACALHLYPKQRDWFPFVSCVEGVREFPDMKKSLKECSKKSDTKLNLDDIQECAAGHLGRELERQLAEKTNILTPAHQWVPWVTVNGIPLWDDNDNLWQYICAAYPGERPAVCFAEKPESVGAPAPSKWMRSDGVSYV